MKNVPIVSQVNEHIEIKSEASSIRCKSSNKFHKKNKKENKKKDLKKSIMEMPESVRITMKRHRIYRTFEYCLYFRS